MIRRLTLPFSRTLVLPLLLLFMTGIALAKDVRLEWAPIEGSVSYELEILQNSVENDTELLKTKNPKWKGDLPFGVHTYRVRGVDRALRPGEWSELTPLVILPGAPKLLSPADDAEIQILEQSESRFLKWEPVPAVEEYRVQILQNKKTVLDQIVHATELEVKGLAPAAYTWTVQAIIKPTGRNLSSLEGRQWEGKTSDPFEFEIEFAKLDKPSILSPSGHVLPQPTGKILFAWKKVERAKVYEVTLEQDTEAGKPSIPPRVFKTDKHRFMASVAEIGSYRVKVRALASATTVQTAVSESSTSFDLSPADPSGGKGYIGLSGLFSPYQYGVQSSDGKGSLDSKALTLRLTGETWLVRGWGMGGGIQNSFVKMSGTNYSWMDLEVFGKYNIYLGRTISNFLFIPKVGLESRQYLFLSGGGTQGFAGSQSFTSNKVSALGPSVGFDLRKQIDSKWSVGMKVAYFNPMLLVGAGGGSRITQSKNVSVGLQAFNWSSRKWGLGIGVFGENRSLGYSQPSQAPNAVNMDALHLFGSILWKL